MKRIYSLLLIAVIALLGSPLARAWTVYINPSGKYIESVYVETTSSSGTTSEPLGAAPGKQINPLDLDQYGRYVITGSNTLTTLTISNDGEDASTFTADDNVDGDTFYYGGSSGWTHQKMYTFDIYYSDVFISSNNVYAQFANLPSGHSYKGLKYNLSTKSAIGYFTRYKGNIWRLSVLSDYDLANNQPTGAIYGENIKLTGADGADLTFQNGYIYYTTSTTPVEYESGNYYLVASSKASPNYYTLSYPSISTLKMVYADDGSTVDFSKGADGTTFTYIGSAIKPNTNFYVETTNGGSTTTQWFTSSLLSQARADHSNWQHRYLSDSDEFTSSYSADGTAVSYVAKFTISNDKTRITGFECTPLGTVSKVELKTTDGDATKTLPLELTYNYADDGTTITSITATAMGKIYPTAKYYLQINGSTNFYPTTTTEDVTEEYNNSSYQYEYTFNKIDYTDWTLRSSVGSLRIKSSYINSYDHIKISVTLPPDGTAVTAMSASPMGRSEVASSGILPLTEADFTDANGKAKPHYFLVGDRTASWRMLPEWELTPNSSGSSATLSGRFMYCGRFAIAMVDNYSDYCAQKYQMYSWDSWQNQYLYRSTSNIKLQSQGFKSAIDYESPEESYTYGGAFIWGIGSDSTYPNYLESSNLATCDPVYKTEMTVTLDSNGAPTKLSFDWDHIYTSEIFDYSSVALVGSDLTGPRNADDVSLDYLSLESANIGSNTSGWAGSWVSCDADGTPYQGADGTTLPLTAYDRAWLDAHPVTLYNNAIGKTISSKDITFVPASELADDETDRFRDLYKMHPTVSTSIGSGTALTSGEFNLIEQIEANGTTEGPISANGWKCYVLKDLWLNGQFKVWTGWGGNIKKYNGADDEDDDNAEQWYSVNGGHGIANTDVAVYGYDPKSGTVNRLYSMALNVDNANFEVKSPSLFNRVLLWYNPTYSDGLNSSVLQFVQLTEAYLDADGSHNITTAPTERDDADQCTVVGYTIYRYKRNADGKYIFDGVVKSVSRGDEEYDSEEASYWTVSNLIANPITLTDESYGDGKAYYAAEYTFEKDGIQWVATTPGLDDTSNGADGDIDINVFQQTATGTSGDAKGQKLYSFNVEADITVYHADDPATLTNHSIIVTADSRTGSLLNTATSFEVDGETLSENKLKINDFSSNTNEIDDAYYWEIPIQNVKLDSKGRPVVHLVWHNVVPTCTEDGTLNEWKYSSSRSYGNFSDNSLVTTNTADEGFTYVLNAYLIEDQWTDTYTGKLPGIEALPTKPDVLHWDGDYQDEDGKHYYVGQSLWAVDTDNTQVIAPGVTISNTSFTIKTGSTSDMLTKLNSNDYGGSYWYQSAGQGLYEPSGSRLRVMDGNTPATSGRKKSYAEVNPVIFTEANIPSQRGDISFLPVTDEVVSNFDISYNLYVYPTDTYASNCDLSYVKTDDQIYNYQIDWKSGRNVNGIYSAQWGLPDCAYDWNHNSSTIGNLDGSSSDYLYGDPYPVYYGDEILTTYKPKWSSSSTDERKSAADHTFVHDGNFEESDPPFVFGQWIPDFSLSTTSYVKYQDLYDNGSYPEHAGFFAHMGIELNLNNADSDPTNGMTINLNKGYGQSVTVDYGCEVNYVGFYVKQDACNEDGVGCYPTTTEIDGVPMYKHTFAGTSAANGGLPLNFQYGDIAPISYNGKTYEQFDTSSSTRSTTSWSGYDDSVNNWSMMARKSGRLAIMVNPVYHYATHDDYVNGTMSGSVQVYVSYNLPILYTQYNTISGYNSDKADDIYIISNSNYEQKCIYLDDVNLATGVEEVEGDLGAGDGEAVYYNLQGIRVENPERGQIYIVRRGGTATKVLMK